MRLCGYQNHYHRFIKFITFNSTEVLVPASIRTQLSGGKEILCVILLVHYLQLLTNFWKCYMCTYGKYSQSLNFLSKIYFLQKVTEKEAWTIAPIIVTTFSQFSMLVIYMIYISYVPSSPECRLSLGPDDFSRVGMSHSLPLSLSLFTVLLFTLLISVHAAHLVPNLYNFSYLHM